MNKTILKRAGLIVASAALVLTPLVGLASSEWGPAREIKAYTPGIAGFDHPQFNSFTGTPSYGDERTFFDGRDSKITGDGNFEDNIDVTNSDEVMLRIYGHNNADPSTNGANNDGVGVAKGTKVRVQLPTDAARSLRANAFISASNAKPGEVFDSADFQTSGAGAFKLSYVPGSASISTRGAANGAKLDDSVATTGALVGYNALDGVVPGCFNFDFVVTLKVKVAKSEVSFQKFVRKAGDTSGKLTELGGLKAGDKVEWLLVYKNGTDQTITNAFIRDQLPAHVKLVPGTVKQYDSNFPNGFQRTDEGIFTGTGISIGNVGPGANGSIRFQTTVSDDLKCGDNPMTNNAWFRSDQTSEQGSSAVIKADKVCTTTVTPPTTPNTPAPELPQTGAEGAAAGALGTGAVGYSLRAYLRSKRSLLDALKR